MRPKPSRPPNVRKILVGLDGTALSERSLPWAVKFAPRARIVLGGAFTPIPMMGSDPWMDVSPQFLGDEGVKSRLERVAAGLRPTPRVVTGLGSPAGALLEIADQERCDLIAIVSLGGAKLRRRMFGGTTENLLHHSTIPLMVVPAAGRISSARDRIRRIAVPLDGSNLSESILPWAGRVAREHKAELLLIHCFLGKDEMVRLYESWGTPALSPGLSQDLEHRVMQYRKGLIRHFKELASRLKRQGLRAKAVLVTGSLPEGVVNSAGRHHADLIMMSAHGHGAFRHLLQGSMVSTLIHASDVPVLVQRFDSTLRREEVRPRISRKPRKK